MQNLVVPSFLGTSTTRLQKGGSRDPMDPPPLLKFVQLNGLLLGTQPVQVEAGQVEQVSSINVINSTYIPNSKTTVLEAAIAASFSDGDIIIFEPDQKNLFTRCAYNSTSGWTCLHSCREQLEPGTSLGKVSHFQLTKPTEPVEEAEIHLVEQKCSVGRQTDLEQSSTTEEEI